MANSKMQIANVKWKDESPFGNSIYLSRTHVDRPSCAQRQRLAPCVVDLLEDVDIQGATGILMNITGSSNMTLHEVNEAAVLVQEAAHEEANIIFGAVIDDTMVEDIRLTVIATGFGKEIVTTARTPVVRSVMARSVEPAPVVRTDTVAETPVLKRRDVDSLEFRKRAKELGLDAIEDDEYDVPTFLRRQVD